MTKTILSPPDELVVLKSKLDRLAARKAETNLRYHREWKRLKARALELEKPIKESNSPPEDLPSFMRPTSASMVRIGRSQQQPTTPQGEKPRRTKGPKKRDKDLDWYGPSFAKSTVSSDGKASHYSGFFRHRRPCPDSPPTEPTSPSVVVDLDLDQEDLINDDFPNMTPTSHETASMAYQEMSKRTRLKGYWGLDSFSAKAYVPEELGFGLLGEALELARQAFHQFFRQRVPELWRTRYYMGPNSIRFGFSEMQHDLVDYFLRRAKADPTRTIRLALDSLTAVRNAYCHFRGDVASRCYDEDLKCVQELLVALGDEDRAMRARVMRDRLKQSAEQSVVEMETMGLFSGMPYHNGFDWAPHHEFFFSWYINYQTEESWSLAVRQAVEDWVERRIAPGQDRRDI